VLGTGICPDGTVALACDVECESRADCATLSDDHDCVNGRCRRAAGTLPIESEPTPPEPLGRIEQMVVLPDLDDSCCFDVGIGLGGSSIDHCTFSVPGLPVPLCTSEWTACNDPLHVDGADVRAALQHPDVVRHILSVRRSDLGEGPYPNTTFGWDGLDANPRAAGASVGYLSAWGTEGISVRAWSHDCSERVNGVEAPAGCVPLPEGLRALTDLLETLKMQQLALGTCAPDRGCYADVGAGCEATPPFYTYDAISGSCVAAAACPSESSTFPNLLACEQTCGNDPCREGALLAPEACAGASVQVSADPAATRCFDTAAQACVCACTRAGAPLDNCSVQGGPPAFARCGP
jgi:hypothetical protein